MGNKEKKTNEFEELSFDLLDKISGGNWGDPPPFSQLDPKGYDCPYCSMNFSFEHILYDHIDKMHPDQKRLN